MEAGNDATWGMAMITNEALRWRCACGREHGHGCEREMKDGGRVGAGTRGGCNKGEHGGDPLPRALVYPWTPPTLGLLPPACAEQFEFDPNKRAATIVVASSPRCRAMAVRYFSFGSGSGY